MSGAVEYDDRPGTVRDALVGMVCDWQEALSRCVTQAVEHNHLRPDTDTAQLIFEMQGLILALHHDVRFLRKPDSLERARVGFTRLIWMWRIP